jgi:hypothetical protein
MSRERMPIPASAYDRYYLISLKWSEPPVVTFWGPDDKGYTRNLDKAGVYTRATLEAHPSYYQNGVQTIAVPIEVADRVFIKCLPETFLDGLLKAAEANLSAPGAEARPR